MTQNMLWCLHVMVWHAPYFVDKYSSLAIWSCQGLENSHHGAKNANQRHTQHSGGKSRKNALLQPYQHWYRIIAHRFIIKENVIASTNIDFTTSRRSNNCSKACDCNQLKCIRSQCSQCKMQEGRKLLGTYGISRSSYRIKLYIKSKLSK